MTIQVCSECDTSFPTAPLSEVAEFWICEDCRIRGKAEGEALREVMEWQNEKLAKEFGLIKGGGE